MWFKVNDYMGNKYSRSIADDEYILLATKEFIYKLHRGEEQFTALGIVDLLLPTEAVAVGPGLLTHTGGNAEIIENEDTRVLSFRNSRGEDVLKVTVKDHADESSVSEKEPAMYELVINKNSTTHTSAKQESLPPVVKKHIASEAREIALLLSSLNKNYLFKQEYFRGEKILETAERVGSTIEKEVYTSIVPIIKNAPTPTIVETEATVEASSMWFRVLRAIHGKLIDKYGALEKITAPMVKDVLSDPDIAEKLRQAIRRSIETLMINTGDKIVSFKDYVTGKWNLSSWRYETQINNLVEVISRQFSRDGVFLREIENAVTHMHVALLEYMRTKDETEAYTTYKHGIRLNGLVMATLAPILLEEKLDSAISKLREKVVLDQCEEPVKKIAQKTESEIAVYKQREEEEIEHIKNLKLKTRTRASETLRKPEKTVSSHGGDALSQEARL